MYKQSIINKSNEFLALLKKYNNSYLAICKYTFIIATKCDDTILAKTLQKALDTDLGYREIYYNNIEILDALDIDFIPFFNQDFQKYFNTGFNLKKIGIFFADNIPGKVNVSCSNILNKILRDAGYDKTNNKEIYILLCFEDRKMYYVPII